MFAFGDARFYGSTGDLALAGHRGVDGRRPPTASGYWLVAGDGGIFAFGDARFYGSTGRPVAQRLVVVAGRLGPARLLAGGIGRRRSSRSATPRSTGSLADGPAATPVTQIVPTSDGQGLLAARPRRLELQLRQPAAQRHLPRLGGHRGRRRLPGAARPGHRLLLQPLRAVRGVVLALRHLGLAAGWVRHPELRLHRGHVLLGRGERSGPARRRHPGPRRRRALRDRALATSTPRCTSGWWPRCGRTARS